MPYASARPPEITVIVPAWNAADDLAHCLRALEAQTLARDSFEVIVVDNGSTDGTAGVAQGFAGVRVVSEPAPGSYNARNAGLALAQGDYVAFTDADCRPAADWLREALAACRSQPGAGLIGGRIELFGDAARAGPAEFYERMFGFRQAETLTSGRCATANWISPKAVLDQLGGFDGALKSGGDYDLSLRIGAAGYPLAYADAMVVRHPARTTMTALTSKRRRTVGGRWAMRSGPARPVKMMVRGFANAAHALRRVLAYRDLTMLQAFGVASIIAILFIVEVDEIIRLMRGKPPNRA